ncbi:LysR family transcriptional regulator [Pseudomonas sp. Pseusp16]|jgi:DNA-binding transcriptional LysR family regulator|uniref:LysR family transcriptional regulator n=1 Tax=Pseudomonas TaxID=286 RepID=UPI0039B5C17C
MLNLNRLHLLSELSVLGTISAVAEAVHLTRPAVSQQLAMLEQELDVTLFQRAGRTVELTPVGRRLAYRATEIFRLVNEIEAELDQGKDQITGDVRIAAFGSVAVGIVPNAIRSLLESQPQLNVTLIEQEPSEGVKAAAANQVDLSIIDDLTNAEPYVSKLDFFPLCIDYFDLVTSSNHRLANRKLLHLNELAGERWAMNTSATTYYSFLNSAFHAAGFEPNVISNCRNMAATLEMVRTGIAVTLLPRLTLQRTYQDPDFQCIRVKAPLTRRIFMVVPKGAARRPSVNAVIKALQEAVPVSLAEDAPSI